MGGGGVEPSPAVGNTLSVEQKLLHSLPILYPSVISTKDKGGLCRCLSSAIVSQGHLGQLTWASVVSSRKWEQYLIHRVTEMK